jgi:hypothetical protein
MNTHIKKISIAVLMFILGLLMWYGIYVVARAGLFKNVAHENPTGQLGVTSRVLIVSGHDRYQILTAPPKPITGHLSIGSAINEFGISSLEKTTGAESLIISSKPLLEKFFDEKTRNQVTPLEKKALNSTLTTLHNTYGSALLHYQKSILANEIAAIALSFIVIFLAYVSLRKKSMYSEALGAVLIFVSIYAVQTVVSQTTFISGIQSLFAL